LTQEFSVVIGRCLLVLGSLVGALIVGEVTLHMVPGLAASPSYDIAALDAIVAGDRQVSFDAELGWVSTPYVEGSEKKGVTYRHNRDGVRVGDLERSYSSAPVPGVQRLVAYGDSFTYCTTVNMNQCWTKRLEDALPTSEVVNFGVPGYGPDQAWLRYQRERMVGPQSCAVLIGVMIENIDRVVNRFRPFYDGGTGLPLAKPRYLVEQGQPVLLPSPAQSVDNLKNAAWVQANLSPHDYWHTQDRQPGSPMLLRLVHAVREGEGHGWNVRQAYRMYQPGTEPFEVLAAVITGFVDQVRADGASPVVLLFPTDTEIVEQRDRRPKPHQPLLDLLQARGVTVVDLTDSMGQLARTSKLGDLIAAHYRPAGNALVAETLVRQLPTLIAPTCRSNG
jgi:hypothetical protein